MAPNDTYLTHNV